MAIERHQRSDGAGRVSAGGVAIVIVVSLLGALMAFVWTIEHDPEAGTARPVNRRIGPSDPNPGWGAQARAMYAQGRFEALAESGRTRMRTWGYDANGWLFAGLAYEALSERPGPLGMRARGQADRIWADLLRRVEPWRAYAGPDGVIDWSSYADSGRSRRGMFSSPYYAGWALSGLGRHMEASERFGRLVAWYTARSSFRGDPNYDYNRACYLALAGEGDAALASWVLAVARGRVNAPWAGVDPDLASIHGDSFDWLLRYAESRGRPAGVPDRGRDRGGRREAPANSGL